MNIRASMPGEIQAHIVALLHEKGITPNATMKRHIMGLTKALETIAQMKR